MGFKEIKQTHRVKHRMALLRRGVARHAYKKNKDLGLEQKQANYESPIQGWCNISYYLDILKGRVNSTIIYEVPTRFKELNSYCGGYTDESYLDLALWGLMMMQEP